jgi:hypothetical protein
MKIVFSNKNIHSLSSVAREKVRDLPLNMCFALQNNSYNSILKSIVNCCTLTHTRASKQMNTQIINDHINIVKDGPL